MDQEQLWEAYRQMLRSRSFEEAVMQFWHEGAISGEMHLGIGEEAIVAAILLQLREGDALALDHRGTPPMVMRGVDPLLLLHEFLGHEQGLCHGHGGHMHLFSPEHLAASSGIVGSSGPAAVGFALAGQRLRPGSLAVAFFGEGAMNQGMLLESLNLAAAWQLPILFVCKDNEWAITTRSASATAGALAERAQGFGLAAVAGDGTNVARVWPLVAEAMARARAGEGPTFLHLRCVRPQRHFLGDAPLRMVRQPLREMRGNTWPMLRALWQRPGGPWRERRRGLGLFLGMLRQTWQEARQQAGDPVQAARQALQVDQQRLQQLEAEVAAEMEAVVAAAAAA